MIKDYTELKNAVNDWLKRSELESKTANFVQLAEAHFNRCIRVPEMEARVTISANGETASLPDNFLALREVHLEGATTERPLKYVTPQELSYIENSGYSGNPFAFTILDGQLKLFPEPSAELNLDLVYIQKIPELSDENTSNWLLESHPDIYLYCALLQAEGFLYNDRRMPIWERKCDMAIAALNDIGNKPNAYPSIPRVRNVI